MSEIDEEMEDRGFDEKSLQLPWNWARLLHLKPGYVARSWPGLFGEFTWNWMMRMTTPNKGSVDTATTLGNTACDPPWWVWANLS